ncbi:MAG: hypothetical protein A2521_02000 [Deltaproteobacteria bacterium RIFOXYD12_FULL_57_12]|nr:MAG: hypothetical protein A2521_02000 [Deltaproteobacteria bacterium RIFOXYD12_FULL_57_12]
MQKSQILALVIVGILAFTSPALAGKPSKAGDGNKGGKHEQKEKRESNGGRDDGYSHNQRGDDVNVRVYFGDQHRQVIRNYYTEQYRSGHCPPGLAKKNNGCMPPGQARKWQVGRPLPRGVIFHALPPAVVVQLGLPPAGHRFVRVASDILLMAVGTGMIVDAVQDLSGN